jgi:phenylacetate-CoA ligase
MPRIERITGRADDMMIVRGANAYPSQVEQMVLRIEGLSPHFLCVLTRPDRLDILTVRTEARPDVPSDRYADLASALEALLAVELGLGAKVEVGEPGAIERSVGKAKRVLDLR